MAYAQESAAEANYITLLSSNLGDGMRQLRPANIGRPLKIYSDIEPIPDYLAGADEYAERFLDWQVERQKYKTGKLVWSSADVMHDVRLYVVRRIWQVKAECGAIESDAIKMIVATVMLHKKYRADVHQALNHVVKHNVDVKKMRDEMAEHLDAVVLARLTETTESLAGHILATMPMLQAAVKAQLKLEDNSNVE